MFTYGLIGHPLSHSFSQEYFSKKFVELGIDATHRYLNFDLGDLTSFHDRLKNHAALSGCNVTIPYKEAIIPYLDELDPVAARIGAVNTIAFRSGKLIGFNTDYLGFREDLKLQRASRGYAADLAETTALVLGTGGASKAILEAFRDLNVIPVLVSRTPGPDQITYEEVTQEIVRNASLIVNTTPLGMYPRVDTAPQIPYVALSRKQFCYDLVYNPEETRFLRLARGAGAGAVNGLGMLHRQAEAAWEIWNR